MRDYRILAAVVCAALLGRCCDAVTSTNKPTQLFSFSGGADGGIPQAGLIQGIDGFFYGTTSRGGASNTGTVFKITSAGTLTTLYSFTGGADGATPEAELVQGSDGFFYGTALLGGSNNNGGVFQISSNGAFTALHDFTGVDGAMPLSTLVEGSDGNFYGTTSQGGANNTGTVFAITTAGTFTTLYSFTGTNTDGAIPKSGLVQGTNGLFYGTTYLGGTNNDGTVFEISSNGVTTTLYQFDKRVDGRNPQAALVLASDGNFYGTTRGPVGTLGKNDDGTAFVMSSAGTLNTIHQFNGSQFSGSTQFGGGSQSGGPGGRSPRAAFIQGADGLFYAMTTFGGYGFGNVFQMLSNGVTTTIYNFFGSLDGGVPTARLAQGSDGYFYGTTGFGGPNLHGVVFRITAFPGGVYRGLAIQTNAPTAASSGFLTLNLGISGSFMAKLTMAGLRSSFRGQFDVPGNATNSVPQKSGNPLQVILHLNDTSGSNVIDGAISDGVFTSQLSADIAYNLTNHYRLSGRYTFTLAPANTNDTTVPQGFGYGTLTVSKAGNGRLSGVLGDGTLIKASAPMSQFDTFPFYTALYNQKQGASIGSITLSTNAASTNATLAGTLDWFKPPTPTDHFYPAGFATTVTVDGVSFVKPSHGIPSVAGNEQVILGGGNTLSNIVKDVVIDSNGLVTVTSPGSDQLIMAISPTSGQLIGSFFNPALNKTILFNGLFLQTNNAALGAGFFRGTNQTGFVILTP